MKDPYEKVFIKQVFYGCIRYEEFLKIFTKVFYERHPQLNRNDIVMFSVFAYLAFFRLDELAITDFKKLVQSQESYKMHIFLQFVFNTDNLREHCREPWMACYDFEYLDAKVICGIEKALPSVADILRATERRATGKVTTLSATSLRESQDG